MTGVIYTFTAVTSLSIPARVPDLQAFLYVDIENLRLH